MVEQREDKDGKVRGEEQRGKSVWGEDERFPGSI